jgi:hypothetical protein
MIIPNRNKVIHSKKNFAIVKIDLPAYLQANVPCVKVNCKQNPGMVKIAMLNYIQLIDSFLIPLQ